MKKEIIIGSRGSDLALWQANYVQSLLNEAGVKSTIVIIKTKGDEIQHLSFDKIEGKGFFTKEIEDALLRNEIDLAVHSHKDLETNQPVGLTIGAVSHRADARELLLIRPESIDQSQILLLSPNATIGTSSSRRKAQVNHLRSDIIIKDIRGNVPTRIRKLRDGEYDAILLAKAGVDRLQIDLTGLHALTLEPTQFVPAPAQGVLALQCRTADTDIRQLLLEISDEDVRINIGIERAVLNKMNGGCQLPLGVYVEKINTGFVAHVAYAKDWQSKLMKFTISEQSPELLTDLILAKIHA